MLYFRPETLRLCNNLLLLFVIRLPAWKNWDSQKWIQTPFRILWFRFHVPQRIHQEGTYWTFYVFLYIWEETADIWEYKVGQHCQLCVFVKKLDYAEILIYLDEIAQSLMSCCGRQVSSVAALHWLWFHPDLTHLSFCNNGMCNVSKIAITTLSSELNSWWYAANFRILAQFLSLVYWFSTFNCINKVCHLSCTVWFLYADIERTKWTVH